MKLYHGNRVNLSYIDPAWMMNGNCQIGVGIYFTSRKETALVYGPNIFVIEVDKKYLLPGMEMVGDHFSKSSVYQFLKELHDIDSTIMYNFLVDYGMDESVQHYIGNYVKSIKRIVEFLLYSEIRNFQLDIAERFGVINFVICWNRIFRDVKGLMENRPGGEVWASIIDNSILLQ